MELPETDTVLVFEVLILAVCVRVEKSVLVAKMVFETVVVADPVFVVAAVAVPRELCVVVFELLIDAVYVPEDVDVFVKRGERVSVPDRVPAEADADPVDDIVGGGTRVTEAVAVSLTVLRRETLPETDAVEVRDCFPVAEPVGVVVSVRAGIRVTEPLREMGLSVSPLQRVGEGELLCVFVRGGLRVGLTLLLIEREAAGEKVPVFEDVIVRVAVPEAVGVLDRGPLRLPVDDTVDVFD